MKIRYLFWLLLVGSGCAQIVPGPSAGGGGSCYATGGANCTAPGTLTGNINVGDTVIAISAGGQVATNPTPGGCSLSWPAGQRYAVGGNIATLWVIPHATTAVTGCNITVTGLSASNVFMWQAYSNVQAVGTLQFDNTVVSGTTISSQTLTSTSAGSFIVGMFFTFTANVAPFTIVGPSIGRRNNGSGSGQALGGAIADQTASAGGQAITISYTMAGSTSYRRGAIELVPAATNPTAQPGDAMQTVVMNASRNKNYVLPSDNSLSPTWCTWFMPTGSHTYELEPQASTQINSQSNNIRMPSWQMSRICRDNNGNYWASPPLLAGTGIALTGSATGITISAAGGAGVMTQIAGGTTHIPGTVQLDPDSCDNLAVSTGSTTPSASGVRQTDVVSWSLQPSTSGWAQGRVNFHAIAYDGSITWRACNSGTTAYTPVARDVNWYVARSSTGAVAAPHKVATRHKPQPAQKVVRPTK